jgi:hypothetical protein
MRRAQESTERWFRHYEWLQRYFSDEEAHQYAEELTEAGEDRKPRIGRSSSEIKREMELISHIEASVQTVRVIVGIVVFFCPVFMTAWLRSHFCGDRCENTLASIPQWASLLLLIAFTFGSILLAVAVSDLRFWKRYLDVLRRKRMQSFWEWRSATLRFPTGHTMYSSDFDRSELLGPGEFKDKPPVIIRLMPVLALAVPRAHRPG